MNSLSTHKKRYEELMKNPLLFLHIEEQTPYQNNEGVWIKNYLWEPLDKDFKGGIETNAIKGNEKHFALVIAEANNNSNEDSAIVSFNIHSFNVLNHNDWQIVFNSFKNRLQNPNDKFPFMYLLWVLNYCEWNSSNIIEVLGLYDVPTLSTIINGLCDICRCLSYTKQQHIQQALSQFRCQYNIYCSPVIKDALLFISPHMEQESTNQNLFELIDHIYLKTILSLTINKNPANLLLCLYHWLREDGTAIDFSKPENIYSFSVSSNHAQLDIIRRYFHDIRNGVTTFDTKIIEQFKENPYTKFIRYRYCLETPEMPIDMAVPLLCDILLTLHQSKGQTFQTVDGILDLAIQKCDVTKPAISFGLENFLPQCDGGAIYNSNFIGFIDSYIVCELDESKFTEENLSTSIRKCLDQRYRHHTYYVCKDDDPRQPLTDANKTKCFNKIRCTNLIQCEYQDQWAVNENDCDWLNNLLIQPLSQIDRQDSTNTLVIDINQTSTKVFANYIRSLTTQFEQVEGKRFIIPSGAVIDPLLKQYLKPLFSRFIPLLKPIIGIKFDVFGIYKAICKERNLKLGDITNETAIEFQEREAEELRKRVIETLKQELKVNTFNGSYFEVPYEKELHNRILNLYYFKGSIPKEPKDFQIEFLRSQYLSKFKPFCAPELAESINQAVNLPYFWCRGSECFHNNLDSQTLERCSSWNKYSLYHLMEIIGYSKLKETEAGLEPESSIRIFIACVNRVMKKFNRLKCRSCGHLMYADRSSGYNRYNYFSCVNSTCSEYKRPIYLNYCYKCKTSLIDSRDSTRCPNGWYICPSCLSCCDNSQYERLAQRFILDKKQIPLSINEKQGKGHNDKGTYFCFKCGEEVIYTTDEHGFNHRICQKCKTTYNL